MLDNDASAFAVYRKVSKLESLPLLQPSAANVPAKATGGIKALCGGTGNTTGACARLL